MSEILIYFVADWHTENVETKTMLHITLTLFTNTILNILRCLEDICRSKLLIHFTVDWYAEFLAIQDILKAFKCGFKKDSLYIFPDSGSNSKEFWNKLYGRQAWGLHVRYKHSRPFSPAGGIPCVGLNHNFTQLTQLTNLPLTAVPFATSSTQPAANMSNRSPRTSPSSLENKIIMLFSHTHRAYRWFKKCEASGI